MAYVQGLVAAVPVENREAYQKHSEKVGAELREHGALGMVECWGIDIPEGRVTSFPLAVKREEGEGVVFSWISWPSKEVCDEAWKKVRASGGFRCGDIPELFDGKRMIFGGFEVFVDV
ncbi:MAG: DUF1428 domain-containing protein [Hyphomicrobiales bacterium]|nr:DUF1428 domain-containing protein [Hyphomicrobiales bacterium]MCY4048520.1 DUF1428 domain-containing protein [Hyphomicrobiales bacterium]MCY4053537.1 DUF1428 domain-containing protein [Hyphomicrobiales bacterium]